MDNLNDKINGVKAGNKIKESTMLLRNRDKGLSMVTASMDNNAFFDKFTAELNDIETINDRMERDIERKIRHRIQKFGADGKRILGIHIKVPERTLEEIGRLGGAAANLPAKEAPVEQDQVFMTQ